MVKEITISIPPEIAYNNEALREYIINLEGISKNTPFHIQKLKSSIDARSKSIKVNLKANLYVNDAPPPLYTPKNNKFDVTHKPHVLIIGSGPAGLFAALKLIELGLKPIILERGKNVRERRRDLTSINRHHIVNEDSNYCFGEGGAGTYSDGKLYTRSDKRGDVKSILETFVDHGASEEILYEAHPHIGTNMLPKIIENIREKILSSGGEIHFNERVSDLIINNDEITGVMTHSSKTYFAKAVILCTGHSARDIFFLLNNKGIQIENKAFALGVRIEHPQSLIDKIQYHTTSRNFYLPAASYSLTSQVVYNGQQKGVFSFCMCPGGFIVPSATKQGEVVVNGMSPSKRDSLFANSGIVVSVDDSDWIAFKTHGSLAALHYQMEFEQKCCQLAGNTQLAPAQLMVDFVNNKQSATLNSTSYQPGLSSVIMDMVLPLPIAYRLREAFKIFGQKMKGYYTNEAQIIGIESRTSSPVKIPRNKTTLEHIQIKRLFPCGEGAGYAGGIVSAAIDGVRCAEQVSLMYN